MKTILKTTAVFFFLTQLVLFSNEKQLNNFSNVWYSQVWEFEQWKHQAKHTRVFNDNGNIIEHIIQEPDVKNNWINKYKIEYGYNEKELLTNIITYVWDNENWRSSTKLDIIYNDKDLIKERNFKLFKDDKWENDVQFAYEYSQTGKVTLETFSRWNDNDWQPYTKLIYQYDSLDLNTEILNTRFLDSVWVNYGLTLNFYNLEKLLVKSTLFGWDLSKKAWLNYEQNLYSYDDKSRLIEWINQQGDNDVWFNTTRETYEYTDFGSLFQIVKYRSGNDEWKNSIRITYLYDNKGDSLIILMEEWQFDNWVNKERRIREDMISTVYEENEHFVLIYPNPTDKEFRINFGNQFYPYKSYEIFNLSGESVQKGNLDYFSPSSSLINVSNLTSGIYLIILKRNGLERALKFYINR
ncbi:MAG: T9SS type A sorting domain-containing protein [Candidatus Kapabacteria bacterium]|nr:T9SS type A sorting domain-containing protein [Candidatus Kapabacteria bacterium]